MKVHLITLVSLFFSLSVHAKNISGVDISENISLSDNSKPLVLNGTGIRSKFIFDIYIGSLYLEEKQTNTSAIYNAKGQKSIRMHFLYDEVSQEKLVSGWNDGFEGNNSEEELAKLKSRINQFNSFFIRVKKGDTIYLNFFPSIGTEIVINNSRKGIIKGNDFFTAILKIWLGDDPADEDLKAAMLGQ